MLPQLENVLPNQPGSMKIHRVDNAKGISIALSEMAYLQ
jgi:hypothetical protein